VVKGGIAGSESAPVRTTTDNERQTARIRLTSDQSRPGALCLHDARIARALHILHDLLQRADARESKDVMVTVDELNMVVFGFAALVDGRDFAAVHGCAHGNR